MDSYKFTQEEWEHCIKVLKELKEDPFNNPDNQLFSGLVTKIYKKAKKQKGNEIAKVKREHDMNVLKEATIFNNAMDNKTLYSEGEKKKSKKYKTLHKPKNCYVCNTEYKQVHFFYNRLCTKCAEENYDLRFDNVNLEDRNVIITGGRVKIGYATTLKLLRARANVTVTTRFPASALEQFKKEKDYDSWKENLSVYGLDLRNLKAVKDFISHYTSLHSSLDILINNAAQTIKYTDSYYLPLVKKEQELLLNTEEKYCIANSTSVLQETNLLVSSKEYEDFKINRFGQPVDTRDKTSWNSTLEEISMYELLEVNLINQISPYFLIKELMPLLKKSSFKKRFIINVTSSEGQFSYHNKTIFHPHTNMTKAALNMMTRTSGEQFAKEDNVFMYAVDVGWISTGAKEVLREKQFERGYIPPLDSVDGASRILHPIIKGIKEKPILAGTLLKNYKVENW
ncbi:SDR family oxidoreductase [Tenacibaculum sp. M341]|uniref:SDR family oxidoreductase n=1 Tax=Tenacibaculum sp. M341 TaxID=2530339 RepID=UPI00104859C5|nr:SDR family oxidoreductase [Tenacibaculum sp. M341]TCI91150.1 SDR family oxidoreductase [Tenacibaculum sp. M341]